MAPAIALADTGRVYNLPSQAAAPPPPPVANGFRSGNHDLSASIAGTAPDARDPLFAMMANGAYAPDSPEYQQALQDAGWTALTPHADGVSLADAHGNRIPIDPMLLSDDRSGFHAEIYQHEDGGYVVAYRGSEVGGKPSEYMDWVNNGQQGLGMDSAQYSSAIELAKRAEQVFGDGNVALTGHSLGGGLASAASLATGASAVTFNASGLSNATLESLGFNPNAVRDSVADSGQVRRYAVNGDQLTGAQEDIPLLPIIGSPPEAVGHALRIDPPPGTGFGDLHGGGGPNAVYVEAFNHATPTDPALGPSGGDRLGGLVDTGIDTLGNGVATGLETVGDVLRNGPGATPQSWVVGSLLNGASTVVDHGSGALGDVAGAATAFGTDTLVAGVEAVGDLQFNNLASGIREVVDLGGDLSGTFSELKAGADDFVAGVNEGRGVAATYGLVGDVADVGLGTVGDVVDGAVSLLGDAVQNNANATGGFVRDLGRISGLETPADAVAGFVEGTGSVVSNVADGIGNVVDVATDKLGDGVEAVADFAGDVAQNVSDGARDFGRGVADGAGKVADFLNPFN
ncbi:hypothetical protein CMZ84_07540 [Lysobacteraceae bacterium NML93-0399]|nr:hypothetical protein CMZ84_07540 [Xanthomonadaceae bacterium NML93-0399]